jgi:hypothetical protein
MWNSLLCSAVRLPSSASRVLVASLSILFKLQLINQQCRPRKRNTCDCLTCRLAGGKATCYESTFVCYSRILAHLSK